MAAKVDQKAYLQRYLTGSSGEKKKKKKKVVKTDRLKIIDDDLDVSKLRALDGDELDILDQGEDGPQIAGIIDERPEEVKKLEQFKTNSKWRVITQDDGFSSKLQIEEIKRDVKQQEKDNEIIFGKMYSDSEDEQKKDSDASPPRKSTANSNKKSSGNNSDSDVSPPRKTQKKDSSRNNCDNKNKDSDQSPPSKYERNSEKSKKNHSRNYKEIDNKRRDSDSDVSPPRRHEKRFDDKRRANDSDSSPPRRKENHKSKERRKKSRWGTFEEEARADLEQRKHLNRSPSLARKSNKPKSQRSLSSDRSPPRKSQKHDSDASPPRKSRKDWAKRSKRRNSTDSNPSPPRKQRPSKDNSKRNQSASDSDLSPPRKNRKKSPQNSRRKSPDSDLSPPRKYKKQSQENLPYQRSSNSPPPSNKKMARTLDGKLAGLQDATMLRDENAAFRRREDAAFSRMNDDVSGRNAQVVSRKISKRETSEERRALVEKAVKQKELDDKYKIWSKGVKQVEDQQARIADFLHEAAKPLARHKGDKDLEHNLRQVERAGDPMLQYIRERKRERGELGPEKPTYKGQCPPNRFNIRPGYRWDGVDRSNGYEAKYFESQSKRKAQAEEYHKWSCADL